MKILLLAPIHRYNVYRHQKGNKPFVIGQGQQSYFDTMQKMGHKVIVFRYTDPIFIPIFLKAKIDSLTNKFLTRFFTKLRSINNKLYFLSPSNIIKNNKIEKLVIKEKPDLIIFSGGTSSIFPKTLLNLKKKFNFKIFLLWGINPIISSTQPEREMVKKGIIDLVVENDCGYKKAWEKMGAKNVIILPVSSVDPEIHKKLNLSTEEKNKYGSDVCFVGTLTYDRQEQLKQLIDFNLKIWGDIPSGIILDKKLINFYRGKAFGGKMVKIFNASKIVLNFQPTDMECGGNMRTFEIPGCGAFQMVDKYNKNWFKENKEIETFKNIKDLKNKIKYYLQKDNERIKIAEAGYKKTREEHTYKKHFQKIIKL